MPSKVTAILNPVSWQWKSNAHTCPSRKPLPTAPTKSRKNEAFLTGAANHSLLETPKRGFQKNHPCRFNLPKAPETWHFPERVLSEEQWISWHSPVQLSSVTIFTMLFFPRCCVRQGTEDKQNTLSAVLTIWKTATNKAHNKRTRNWGICGM